MKLNSESAEVSYLTSDGKACVVVALATVTRAADGSDDQLPYLAAQKFIEAADQNGAKIQRRLERITARRDQYSIHQPHVYVERWPGKNQPWPVFVAVASEVVEEFYPITWAEQTAPNY